MLDILLSGRPVHHWQKMNLTKRLNTQLPRDFWSHIRVVRIHYPGQPSWQYLKTHVVRVVCAKCLFACYPITMFHLVWEAHLNLSTFSIPSYSHELDQLNLIFKNNKHIPSHFPRHWQLPPLEVEAAWFHITTRQKSFDFGSLHTWPQQDIPISATDRQLCLWHGMTVNKPKHIS